MKIKKYCDLRPNFANLKINILLTDEKYFEDYHIYPTLKK